MLTDYIIKKYKKAYQPVKGCYVLSYYGESFNTYFPEEKARQIAQAAELVVDEILDMMEEEELTEEIIEEFEAEVHERHKDSEVYEDSEFSSYQIDTLFFVTDGFYNDGPFQKPAFEEATLMIGRMSGDDVTSVDWKLNLQASFYATIYTVMNQALTLSEEEIPEECGWLFFVNCIHHMSDATGGHRYHIQTSEDKKIDSIDEFKEALIQYLIADNVWQFEEDQITEDPLAEDTLVIAVPMGRNAMHLRFHVPGLFEQYQSGGWNAVHKTVSQARDAIYSVDPEKVDELLSSYETAEPHLILRPINYTDHRQELVNRIYRTVGDIALVLYFVVSDRGGQLYTTKVPAAQFDHWGVDRDTVMDNALLNNLTRAQPRIYTDPKDTENPPLSKGAFMALHSDVKSLPSRGAVLTTTRTTNGAIAMFYPGVADRIGALFEDDFYVVFTAISEAWVHPKSSFEARSLLMRLKDNNKMFPDSLLSRKVFLYSRADRQLRPLEL